MTIDLDVLSPGYWTPGDPERYTALVAELRAAREAIEAVRSALAPGRWRGFDGPDGVSKDEVIDDVAAAIAKHDQTTGGGR